MALLVTAIGSLGADGLKAAGAFMLISQGMAVMMLGAAGLAVALYFLIPVLASAGFFSFTASLGMTSLAIGIGLAAIAAVLLGGAFMVIAEGLGSILSNAGQATMAFLGMGMGLAAMAVGIAAMFVFISNPMGWFAIAGAMLVMSTALGIFVDGLKSIPEETLSAVSSLAESIAALNAMQAETTIIARVTSDLESFKETMDATLMSQVASLSTFNNVRSMNEVRAETQVQQQIQLPPVELNVTSELTTNIGDKKFAEHVHEASKTINWNNSDGAKKIYLSGYQQTT